MLKNFKNELPDCKLKKKSWNEIKNKETYITCSKYINPLIFF